MKTHGPASCRTTGKPDYGVFDPDKFWGPVLPHPAAIGGPEAFDARVERAWLVMRNMFFTPEEHAAVGEAVARLVSQKQESD
jgi:hypothetical protein